MKTPAYLKKNDTVAIISTARKINRNEITNAINTFEKWGLNVRVGNSIGLEHHQFAGTDTERANDFQSMLNDTEIKAIICARGGYGTVRIIDEIDFNSFLSVPKWIVGYSDITILHSHIHKNCNVSTLHATMPIDFCSCETEYPSTNSLREALFGERIAYHITHNNSNRHGTAVAPIVGGNLSILYSLLGSKSDINTDDKILFIEDLDEYLYHIDRMLLSLKRAGKFSKLKGLVVGAMSNLHDNAIPFGIGVEEMILQHTKEYNFPICFDFPSGHINIQNHAIKMGEIFNLEIGDDFTKAVQH